MWDPDFRGPDPWDPIPILHIAGVLERSRLSKLGQMHYNYPTRPHVELGTLLISNRCANIFYLVL